jgi:ribosomal protein S14
MALVDLTNFQFSNKNTLNNQEYVHSRDISSPTSEFLSILNSIQHLELKPFKLREGVYKDLFGPYDYEKGDPQKLDKDLYSQLNYKQFINKFVNNCERCGKRLSFYDKLTKFTICINCNYDIDYELYYDKIYNELTN